VVFVENMNKANSLVGLLFYEIASYNYSSVNNAINELNENMVTLQKSENDESTKNKIKHIKLTIYKLEKIKRKMEKFNLTKVKQEICEKDFDEKLCQKIKTHYYISNIEYNSILYVVFYRLFKNRVTEENFEIFFRNTSDSICLTDSYSLFTGYPFDKSVLEKLDQKIGTASIDVLLFMNNAAL
jgi:ribosomal protein L17